MKALTICQPYAELIRCGEKRVENRSWPTAYRGAIYIHAGKGRAFWDATVDTVRYPSAAFGAIVAIARLVDCTTIGTIQTGLLDNEYPWLKSHPHAFGPWCWILDSVTPIGPWPWKGQLGLFDIDDGALDRVANQILGIAEPSALPELHTQRTDNAQTNT